MQSSLFKWIIEHTWAIEVFIALVSLLSLNLFLKKILIATKRKKNLKEGDWHYHLDYAALTPARVLLWILLASFLTDLIARELHYPSWINPIQGMRNGAIVICFAWFLLRWKRVVHATILSRHSAERPAFDLLSVQVVGRLFTIAVYFLSTLIILQLFGLDVGPLIAFGGIGAAALGFASKDVVANFFGGVMLSFTRIFSVGDLIQIPQKNIEGYVEEIGWYLTSIRDLEKRPLYVPNWLFATEMVVNQSRMTHRRFEQTIGIRYEDIHKTEEILKRIQAVLKTDENVDPAVPHYTVLKGFSPSTVDLEIKAYLQTTRIEEYKLASQSILLKVYSVIEECGAQMPLPISQVILYRS